MPQFPPAARELPQLLVSPKSPLAEIPLIVSDAVPVLVSVTPCDPLVVPTVWLANVSDVGETPATGAVELVKNSVMSGAVAAPPNPTILAPTSSAITLNVLSCE